MSRASLTLALLLLARATTAEPVSTLDRLVQDLDTAVGTALRGRDLRRCDLTLCVRPGPSISSDLVHLVSRLLVGRLTARGLRRVVPSPASDSAEAHRRRARAGGFELLLDLELLTVEGYLHLRGPLEATDRSLWRDTLQPGRGALHHLHARVRVDAEIHGYQGVTGPSGPSFSPRFYPAGKLTVLALGVGDVDGDGRSELATLHQSQVRVLRFRSRKDGFETTHVESLAPPWAVLQPRRAVGAMVLSEVDRKGRAEVLLRTSAMERGAVFGVEGKQLRRRLDLAGYPLAGRPSRARQQRQLLCQCVAGQDVFDAATLIGALTSMLPAGGAQQLPQTFYALVTAELTRKGGERRQYLAMVNTSGKLQLFVQGKLPAVLTLERVGATLDLVDMDDDGEMELVTTSAQDPAQGQDQITIHRVDAAGNLRLLWRSGNLDGIVTALTHGDIDGDGKIELLGALLDNKNRAQLVLLN